MALRQPENMDELVYFTRRTIEEGEATVWVFRQQCTSCKKGIMGKPKDKKTGKTKVRANEYVCPACQYTVEKTAYEEGLTANVAYRCPACKKEGEQEVSFKRKRIKGAETLRVLCEKCETPMDITKKMKEAKKK